MATCLCRCLAAGLLLVLGVVPVDAKGNCAAGICEEAYVDSSLTDMQTSEPAVDLLQRTAVSGKDDGEDNDDDDEEEDDADVEDDEADELSDAEFLADSESEEVIDDQDESLVETSFAFKDEGIVRLLDFTKAKLVVNNLGGQGPDKVLPNGEDAPEEMRFRDLVQGKEVDLVVTTRSGYQPFNVDRNGILGGNGQINAASDSEVPLTFTFMEKGTDTKYEMPKFYITFSDIDERHGGTEKESIQVHGFEKFYTNDDLKVVERDGEAPIFESSDYGNYQDNEFSPDSPEPTQLSHAVTYLFTNKASFDATFKVSSKPGHSNDRGRNILFSGISQLVFCQESSTYLNFTQAEVTQNNLGGQGPDKSGPEELRYGNIAEKDGIKLDLVATSRQPYGYKPYNVSQNGHHGDFGHINLYCGATKSASEVYVDFKVVKHGTNTPVVLDQFAFVVFDFDTGNHEQQVEYIEMKPNGPGFEGGTGYSSYIVTQTSEIAISDLSNGLKKFTATKHGTESDNPHTSQNMAREVADKSVVFTFRNTAAFMMVLGITPTGFDTGRNFMFSGQDMYLMCD